MAREEEISSPFDFRAVSFFPMNPIHRRCFIPIIKIPFKLSDEDFHAIMDMAGYGIGYWARSMEDTSRGYVIVDSMKTEVDGEKIRVKKTLTRAGTERAVVGLFKERKLNGYYMSAIDRLVFQGDSSDVGSDIADAIVQQAMFGSVVYG